MQSLLTCNGYYRASSHWPLSWVKGGHDWYHSDQTLVFEARDLCDGIAPGEVQRELVWEFLIWFVLS